jgi:two-component system alkaline phosphatase synthesis response regulator PhoP
MEELSSDVEQPVQAPQKKILIIDDTKTIVDYTRHVLLKLGYEDIVVAYDGVTGLEQFYRERPDCVIVDVRMPGLDGFQVVRSIRGDASTANTPLIILSAYQQPDQQLTGILSGVDEYLPKPFKPIMLAEALNRVMKITPEERAQRMERLAKTGILNG